MFVFLSLFRIFTKWTNHHCNRSRHCSLSEAVSIAEIKPKDQRQPWTIQHTFSISFKWKCMASDHVYCYKRNPPESGKFFACKKFRYFLLEECRILGFGISIWLKESEIILTIVVWNGTSTKTSTKNLESMASIHNPRLSWIPLYGLNDDFYKHIRYSK